MYGESRSQANMNSTDVLNKMNINMSQVAAIRAAASKPAAGIRDNEYPAKYKKEETILKTTMEDSMYGRDPLTKIKWKRK